HGFATLPGAPRPARRTLINRYFHSGVEFLTDTMIITGGAGFIGANFVRHALAATDARLVIIDKLTYAGNLASVEDALRNPRVHFAQVDIADKDAVTAIFNEHQPTSVVNFAAESHVDRSIDDPSPFVEANIVGAF